MTESLSRRVVAVLAAGLTALAASAARGQQPSSAPRGTQVVLLGTGTPAPLPDRSVPATTNLTATSATFRKDTRSTHTEHRARSSSHWR